MRGTIYFGLAAMFAAFSLFSACGGGGGGSDSSGVGSIGDSSGDGILAGINYTGETKMAVITEDNAADLALGSYQNGQSGSMTASPLASLGVQQQQQVPPRARVISGTLRGMIENLDITGNMNNSVSRALVQESDTVYGACGGSASVNVTGNPETGAFSGSMNMNNFCENGATATGNATFSGNIDTYLSMTLNEVTLEACGDRFTTSGSLSYNYSSNAETMTMNLLLRESSTGKVYRLADNVYTYYPGYSYDEFSISGRYYDPDYGYVTLSTPERLRVYWNEYWPSAGVLLAQGDNGTWAQLTAFAGGTYYVESDTTGDGNVNLEESHYWSTDLCSY